MKCGCKSCFECKYPDCIVTEDGKVKRRIEKRPNNWYQAHREEVIAKTLARYYANHEENKRKKREAYQRKKMEGLV